ncbi:fruiting body protein SC1 [Flagelloscypha sp. PMI_526]|nr:fruiting body protein SC1 [Flagelloscypha sp. PMI_526]
MRFAALTAFVLPVLAAASVIARTGPQCSTGTLQCCNTVGKADSTDVQNALGGLAAVLGLTGNIGVSCVPINVAAVGGNSCSAQAACCGNTIQNGLVNVNCSPISL